MLIDNLRSYDYSLNTTTTADAIKTMMGEENRRNGNLDLVTGFFSIRGLNFLREVMADETKFRMVLAKIAGVPAENDDKCAIDLLSEDNGIEAMLTLSEDAEKAVEFLSRDNVAIRAIGEAFCHAKSYIFKDKKERAFDCFITGSSNLTDSGLGLIESKNIELNVAEMGHPDSFDAHKLWFDELWKSNKTQETIPSDPNNPKSEKIPVKQYFINLITQTILRNYTPEDIYYKILFEYFKSEIDVDSAEMEKDINLLQNTVIYKDTLFDYQQKGVISLIKMLEKYNGAILADAVGLGKTFSALAVLWYFQNKGYTVAVFCPKKLQQNWEQYQETANSRFEKDHFRYVVNFHTDLQGDRLAQKTKGGLQYLKSQNKLLVVIDESHNLRNADSERYKQLLEQIIQSDNNNRIVKVLHLSATPINNKLIDIRNQFNLIGHGNPRAFDKDFNIPSLEALFKDAQQKYKTWTDDPDRTIGSLIRRLPTRFFDLTDGLIVARTRRMVEETTQSNLGFPQQRDPINIYLGISELGNYKTFDEIYEALLKSNLSAYKPSMYMGDTDQSNWQDNSFREASLVRMMAMLFTKRLESSWYACLSTIEKVLKVHKETLRRVNNYIDSKKTDFLTLSVDDITPEEDDDFEEIKTSLDRNRIQLSEMRDINKFKEDLEKDVKCLQDFYDNICRFRSQFEAEEVQDDKLDELKRRILEKQQTSNKKVVIFTAFADTAEYLFQSLSKDETLRSKIACVTGQRTYTPEGSTNKFDNVLKRFAPKSKLFKEKDWSSYYERLGDDFYAAHYDIENHKWNVSYEQWRELLPQISNYDNNLLSHEIDILIATDCLSEGQNLQDADLVVNYDIHWNPVRLIQRFGRIDRIGSDNETIGSINFWPASDYDGVLNLANRINNRMAAMALAGSQTIALTERIQRTLSDNPILAENAKKLLQQMENKISDIEEPQTVTLANLSLESFRQDLLEYLNHHKNFYQHMPIGAYSGFRLDNGQPIPESLVALVGYPRRKPGEQDKKYEKLYLLRQPVNQDSQPDVEEINIAETLDLLRKNKDRSIELPEWITRPSEERISRLTEILRNWMIQQIPAGGVANALQNMRRNHQTQNNLMEEVFNPQNFDLLVWEYISIA